MKVEITRKLIGSNDYIVQRWVDTQYQVLTEKIESSGEEEVPDSDGTLTVETITVTRKIGFTQNIQ